MTSYNAWNGIPMTVNPVLKDVLRREWHADGIVSSDLGAIEHTIALHNYEKSPEDAYAATIKAGVNQIPFVQQGRHGDPSRERRKAHGS